MTEQELRELVRAAIARHAGHQAGARHESPDSAGMHPSHGRFPLLQSGDEDGKCVIEPTVRCNRCGYCLSYGH
jgi:hypothetical protein